MKKSNLLVTGTLSLAALASHCTARILPRRQPCRPGREAAGPGLAAVAVAAFALGLPAVAGAADLPVKDGLIVWLKADAVDTNDASQVRISGSDIFIKQWKDQSGNTHPAANGTDADQPLYIADGLNGKPVLRFAQRDEDNGSRLYLGDLSAYSANAGTVFAVGTIDNDGRYNLFGNRNNDERWVADSWTESQPGSFRSGRTGMSYGSWPQIGSHVFALESDRAAFRVVIDGSEIGSAGGDYHSGSGQNWTVGNRATSGQQLRGDIPELIIYNHVLTSEEANQVGWYLADKYAVSSAYTDNPILPPQAKIYDFGLPGNPGIIIGNDIALIVKYRTPVTNLAPTYMLSLGATCNKASGSAHDFTTPQTYTVISSDSAITNVYTVTVTVTPPTVTYDFNSGLQGWTQTWPAAGNGNVWENGALGSGGDAGETRFARSPAFTLHGLEALTFQLDGGQSSLAAPAVAPAAIPELAIDGGGFAGVALRDVATDTYVLSKRRTGNGGGWQNNSFTVAELASYAIPGKKYTLDYIDYNKGSWGWTYLDNVSIPGYGTQMRIEATDPVLLVSSNTAVVVSIPEGFNATATVTAYVTNSNPSAITINGSTAPVTTLTFAAGGVNSQSLTVTGTAVGQPQLTAACAGLDSASLTLTVVPPLIGRWISGAANLSETSGYRPAGKHDGVAVGTPAALAFSSDLPPGCTGQSLDLRAGNVGVMVTNSATTDGGYLNTYDDGIRSKFTIAFWAKGFPNTWAPWVSKRGEDGIGWQLRRMSSDPIAGFTMRGVDNEDGWGSSINVNDTTWHHYAGVWNQATGTRTLYVDGVLSHVVNNNLSQMMNLARTKHLALGAREVGGTGFDSYFAGLLFDVRLYSYPLTQSEVRGLIPPTVKLIARSAVPVGGNTPLTVSIPVGANASAPVTVYLTNGNPSLVHIGGSPATVTTLVFAAGGTNSQTLTLNGLSVGQDALTAGASGLASASASVWVFVAPVTPGLIGRWVAGSPHLADLSGFTAGTHDGAFAGAPPTGNFTNDVPAGFSGQSLDLRGVGNTAVRINNTRAPDAGYLPTYDSGISNRFSVAFWAKGFPNEWAGWVTKEGEDGRGWQLRRMGGDPVAGFTLRGVANNEDGGGSTINVNNTNWHHFVGVWDGEAGTRTLYVDGVFSHTIDNNYAPMGLAPNAPLVLGARANQDNNYAGDRWVKCQLFDVRMYSTALTLSDVGNLIPAKVSLALGTPAIMVKASTTLTVSIPFGKNADADVTVWVTNGSPAIAVIEGATGAVFPVTFTLGGAVSQTFNVNGLSVGQAQFVSGAPGYLSDSVTLTVGPALVKLTIADAGLVVGASSLVAVTIPPRANLTEAVAVWVTNSHPTVADLHRTTVPVYGLTFAAGETNRQELTVTGLAVGQTTLTAAAPGMVPAVGTITVYAPENITGLIGHWVAGAPHLADISGFSLAGTHNGVVVGANAELLAFSSEVPPNCTGQSLNFSAGNVGVMINNSSTADAGYAGTFDDGIANTFTIAFWAKGFPDGDWNPWVGKNGEGAGWQVRRLGGASTASFTVRGQPNEDFNGTSRNVNNTQWHHFAGVWDGNNGIRTLYVDGTVDYTEGLMFAPMRLGYSYHLALGARDNGGSSFGNWFKGLLFDVRMYDYPITAAQVAELVAGVTPPPLKVQRWTGNQVRLSWPTSFAGYSIQQSLKVTGGWELSGLVVTVEGSENVAYAPATANPQFFRLKK